MIKFLSNDKYENLIKLAHLVRKKAYAPYSKFYVGTAILAENGKIFLGCNVENAAYGETICAERVAVTKAISEGVKNFLAIAVATNTTKDGWPCGSCRQVLFEFSPNIIVLASGVNGKMQIKNLKELFPFSFGTINLGSVK